MSQTAVQELSLPELRVDVVEPGVRSKRDWTKCEVETDIRFSLESLKSYCLASWEPVVYDAFLLAAAVQFCDHVKRRPLRGWARTLELRVPVHDPARWNDPEVSRTLHRALEDLTGDCWRVTFKSRRENIERPRQRPLALGTEAAAIMPYSNGMDSRAVAGLMAREYGDKLIRVRLGRRGRTEKTPIGTRTPFTALPYSVSRKNSSHPETSARSRGFKFSVLSGMAAHLTGAPEIVVPESGPGALGPWLIPVGQAPADIRNHPLFMQRMEEFLYALLGHRVRFRFPRLWYTKGQTLAAYAAACVEDGEWEDTWSCWQSPQQVSVNGRKRQCGICAACMLRRLAVHAAGFDEPADRYVWENLSASQWRSGKADNFEKVTNALSEYTIAGILHLDHLADLIGSPINAPGLEVKISSLARVLGLPRDDVRVRLERLLTQHELEWTNFVHALGEDSFVAHLSQKGRIKNG